MLDFLDWLSYFFLYFHLIAVLENFLNFLSFLPLNFSFMVSSFFLCILYLFLFYSILVFLLQFSPILFICLCPSWESLSSDVRWSLANCSYLSLLGTKKLTGSSKSLKETSKVEGDLKSFQMGGSDIPEQNLPVSYREKCKPFENLATKKDGGFSLQYLKLSLNFQGSTFLFNSVWCPSVHSVFVLHYPPAWGKGWHWRQDCKSCVLWGRSYCFLSRPSIHSSISVPPSRACLVLRFLRFS